MPEYPTSVLKARAALKRGKGPATENPDGEKLSAMPWHDLVAAGELVRLPVPGCRNYFAGSDGSIWSHRRAGPEPRVVVEAKKWKKLHGEPRREDGRMRYTVRRDDGSYRRCYGAILVLEAFVGPCPDPETMECCHEDGDCTNDAVLNLRWGTVLSNRADMVRHGTRCQGETHVLSRVTEEVVREIRRGGFPAKKHVGKCNLGLTQIYRILNRESWKHVV